jgi:hypothetical protein
MLLFRFSLACCRGTASSDSGFTHISVIDGRNAGKLEAPVPCEGTAEVLESEDEVGLLATGFLPIRPAEGVGVVETNTPVLVLDRAAIAVPFVVFEAIVEPEATL